jgi:hypothetical protein
MEVRPSEETAIARSRQRSLDLAPRREEHAKYPRCSVARRKDPCAFDETRRAVAIRNPPSDIGLAMHSWIGFHPLTHGNVQEDDVATGCRDNCRLLRGNW